MSGVLFPVRADSTDVQTAHWIDADMLYVLRRCRNSSGIWQPWEWENPPMLPDVEYRTTERHNGKPVYRKRITYTNTETIGNASGVTTINIPHEISDFGALVRCDTKIGTYTLPYIASGGGITTLCGVSTASIILRTLDTTWSSREWLFDLAYTK